MTVNIDPKDVTRIIIQFLRENNLQKTLAALESDSNITFNAVENKEALVQDILQGRWDAVLRQITKLRISPEKLIDLYEQIILEFFEANEISTADALLCHSEPMQLLKERDHQRYLYLENLLVGNTSLKSSGTKSQRRQAIAKDIESQVTVVAPSRLLTLLGQSLKWQQHQGILPPNTAFDLFKGTVPLQKAEEDACVTKPYITIKFPGKKSYAECAMFSPNGQYLATGSLDGFIEIWNHLTGKLRKDLRYQAEDKMMAMDNAILALNFSSDNELIVSGSSDGSIAIWKVQTGMRQRRLPHAHSQGITSVCFNKDSTQVLSGSHDHTIKLHGLRSGKTLKEFRGHSSFVNSVLFSSDNTRVISGSSDGTVKIWDTKTTNCLHTVTPHPDFANVNPRSVIAQQTVQSIIPFPQNSEQFLVCNKSNVLYMISLRGAILKTFSHNKKSGADFVAAAISPQGEIIYGIGEDHTMRCFRVVTGELLADVPVGDAEVIGMAGHPAANVLAIHNDAGHLFLYKA